MGSLFPIRSHAHDHQHNINFAIQLATSPDNLDVDLHSSDGSIVSTNKTLLTHRSPFLTKLLSITPTPACLPTCIILPDFSTASIIDLVSLQSGGVGISQFPRSNYVHAVRDIIEITNLLGITPGLLVAEPVGLGGAGTSSTETINQQINATISDENQFGVELLPLVELSQAYVESELASMEKNSDKLNRQKISDNLDISKEPFSENLREPGCDVTPPNKNVVLANRYENQYENGENTQIIQHSSSETSKINQPDNEVATVKNHLSDENTTSGQHPGIIDQQMDDDNNLDGEARSHQSFDNSHTLLSDLYLSDSENTEGLEENLQFPAVLSDDATVQDRRMLNDEEEMKEFVRMEENNGHENVKNNEHYADNDEHENKELSRMEEDNGHENVKNNEHFADNDEHENKELPRMEEDNGHENVKNNEHNIDKATINSEQDRDADHYQDKRTNQLETDGTTKNSEYESGKTIKQHNKKRNHQTKSSERPTNLEEYQNYIVNITFLQCDVCGELFKSGNSRRKCPSCYRKIKDATVLVNFGNDTGDNICRDINMNVSVKDNSSITNHSDSDTKKKFAEKDNLFGECTLQSERVKTTSKRSRSFSQNREKEKKNAKKRKASSKEVIRNSPPKTSGKKESKEDKTAAKDHTHYGAKKHPCKKCSNCIQKDCGLCKYCKDKPKFGGPNKQKQKCKKKLKCSQPVIVCYACKADKSEKDQDQPGKRKSVQRRGMPCGYKHLL